MSPIETNIHIDSTLDGDTISCHILNSDHAKPRNGGIDIANSTKRLNLLYPRRYTPRQGNVSRGSYKALLTMDLLNG